jgi:uridine monophosphate synthetase
MQLTEKFSGDILSVMNFFTQLKQSCENKDSLLCVGLDPRIQTEPGNVKQAFRDAVLPLIENTLPYAAAYKPNIAFYEKFGSPGLEALEDLLSQIPEDTPVILDAKRGDIGSTAEAYAEAVFRLPRVGAVTLNPYMGTDTFEPFLRDSGKGAFILCRTTNPGASLFQEVPVSAESIPLFQYVAEQCLAGKYGDKLGFVVPGNDPEALAEMRRMFPRPWFLVPGVGAQGGNGSDAAAAGLREDGFGLLVNASRSIAGSEDPAKAANRLRLEINQGRDKTYTPRTESNSKTAFLNNLIDAGCFKTGDFVLKSGKHSPFYIDLRRIISFPKLLSQAAEAYASAVKGLEFDKIAGIPTAGLPLAAAVSLRLGVPMIYPRIPVKPHGTGNRIEGEYRENEKVLLLDDLITTGKSKEEAVEVLRGEGLQVEYLTVLLQRGASGAQDMRRLGISIRAYAKVEEFLPLCRRRGFITELEEMSMLDFARKG